MPIASFATIHVLKVEQDGAVSEAAAPSPAPAPGAGEWVSPGAGWDRPALGHEIGPAPSLSSLPPLYQPLEAQPWERWTDVWRPVPDLAAPVPDLPPLAPDLPPDLPPPATDRAAPVPGEPPEPPAEDRPPPSQEPQDPAPADARTDDRPAAGEASAPDTGEWWIDNPPATEADPHRWWIVDDAAESTPGTPTPGPEDDPPGAASRPPEGREAPPARAGRRTRDRRERDAQHGWASSLTPKRTRGRSGPGSEPGENASVSHQLRARRMWAMEEADTGTPVPDQGNGDNVVRLPLENHVEAVAEEARAEQQPVSAIASGGSAGPEAVPAERPATRGTAQDHPEPETVAQEVAQDKPVAPSQENLSPDLKDLLEIAAVQAAVDAIVDAAVRGDDLE